MVSLGWKNTASSAVSAGAIGTFMNLLNVVVGFCFQAALAAELGVDSLADTFQLGWTVVTFVAVVQFTMVTSLLVPQLQAVVTNVNTVGRSRLPFVLGVNASALQAAAALLIAEGDLRVLLLAAAPAHVFVGATAVPQALAYISRRFWVAGAGPIANGMTLVAITVSALNHLTTTTLGIAVALGYAAQWAVTFLGTRDLMPATSRDVTVPARLFAGVLGFTLVSKFQPVLERIVSYQLATGTTAALGYGQKIAQGLVLFATFSFATASTAALARHTAAKASSKAADLLARVTLGTLVFGSFISAVALPAAYPAVVLLFQRGAFSSEDSRVVANVVIAQLPWVWAGALAGVLTAYLYIDRRYAQVLVASLTGLACTLVCGLALSSVLPQYAVAIASSAGMVASLLIDAAILRRTEVWREYCSLLLRRSRLGISAFGMVAVSATTYVVLIAINSEPSFVHCVVATAVSTLSAIAILLWSGDTRRQFREVMNAEL